MMKDERLIRLDVVKKQLDKISFPYPDLRNFVKNDDILEEIFRLESKSIEDNLEDIIINCGDMFFHLLAKQKQKDVFFSYPKYEINRLCRGENHRVIHWHGAYLSFQSQADAASNKEFFSSGATEGCSVGINGLHCRTHYHDIFIPWNDSFYEKLKEKNGVITFKEVKEITCNKVKGKKSNINWFCDVKFKDGKGNYENIFNEVTFEHSKKSNMVSPYTLLESKDDKDIPFARLHNEIYDDGDEVSCSIIGTKSDKKRILSCFKTNF